MTNSEHDVTLYASSPLTLQVSAPEDGLPTVDETFSRPTNLPSNRLSAHVNTQPENVSENLSRLLRHNFDDTIIEETPTNKQDSKEKQNGYAANRATISAIAGAADPLLEQKTLSTISLTADSQIKMGNQHSEKKKESDNDTPDEGKSQSCCKPPKKKSKEKSGKRTSSKSDENDYDVNEVYPFDSRCKEESEVIEPIDLDPFEIVETDELSFVAGAGTSEVILSGSDGKFRISREIILEEGSSDQALFDEERRKAADENASQSSRKDNKDDDSTQNESLSNTETKAHTNTTNEMPNMARSSAVQLEKTIDHSNSLPARMTKEPEKDSSSTKDVKERIRPVSGGSKPDKQNSRMIVLSQDMFTKKDSKTKQTDTDAALEINDTTAITDIKPDENFITDTSKEEPETEDIEAEIKYPETQPIKECNDTKFKDKDTNVVYENVNTQPVEDIIAKQAPIQATIPVKYILTQDMFAKDSQMLANQTPDSSDMTLNGNENIYKSSVDTESLTYPAIPNTIPDTPGLRNDKESPKTKLKLKTSKNDNDIVNISNPTYGYDLDDCIIASTGSQEENIYETVEPNLKRRMKTEGKSDIYASISKPDITDTKSCEDTKISESDISKNEVTFQNPSKTDVSISLTGPSVDNEFLSPRDSHIKVVDPFPISNQKPNQQNESDKLDNVSNDEQTNSLKKTESLELPPSESTATSSREATVPPPSPASMNILTEEDEDAEDDNEQTQDHEIAEFGDIVCKRLSRLLEDVSFHDESATTSIDQDSIIYFSPKEFVDTSTGRYELQEFENFGQNQDLLSPDPEPSAVNKEKDEETVSPKKAKVLEQNVTFDKLTLTRNESAETLKRISGDSTKYDLSPMNGSSDDGLPDFFDPENLHSGTRKVNGTQSDGDNMNLSLQDFDDTLVQTTPNTSFVDDLTDVTPTVELSREFTALPELAKTDDNSIMQYEHTDHATGRRSVTGTESDLDISEQRDDMSTDSMYADDEAEETMDILFTKTYTEPLEGAEVFLSCTVVNSAYKDEAMKKEHWLSSDEALEYFEANPAEVMSTAFMKAKKEMKDIQVCLQNLRKQMDNFQGNLDDISLPDLPMGHSLLPDYHDIRRKAVTD